MFSGLTGAEREAFFGLLDEYFESRPHNRPSSYPSTSTRSAAPSSSSAAAPPPAAPPRPVSQSSSHNQHYDPTNQADAQQQQKRAPGSFLAGKNPHVDNLMANKHVAGALGAASTAWSNRNNSSSSSSSAAASAPPPAPAPKPAAGRGHAAPSGLVSSKGMGGLNTASKGAAFSSLMGNKALVTEEEKQAARQPLRGISSGGTHTSAPVPPPPRRTSAAPAPSSNSTVTALYDFDSSEPGDLPFAEGAVIELLEKPNDDWWKGRLNGREGLIPATYVQES